MRRPMTRSARVTTRVTANRTEVLRYDPSVCRAGRGRDQRGASSILAVALVAVAVALVAAIGLSTPALVEQARADAVADLAALAGVSGGPDAARTVAGRSGAERVRVDAVPGATDGAVAVEVTVGGRSAVATAAPTGDPWPEEPVGGS